MERTNRKARRETMTHSVCESQEWLSFWHGFPLDKEGILPALVVLLIGLTLFSTSATAQEAGEELTSVQQEEAALEEGEQSRESMANDATAAQWSFQLAYEARTWYDDEIAPGVKRPEGNNDMWQLRFVLPLSREQSKIGIPVLPRLTFRNIEAKDGTSGAGNAELFILGIAKEWSTGRFGIGPQVNFPADDEQYGSKEWRYGFATAALERTGQGKILLGVLVQQIWGKSGQEGSDAVVASPITIQPVFNYSLPKGFYLNIGETALSYHWQAKQWLVPVGIRFGKLWVLEKSTWNLYGEYRTSVIYDDWPGSAIKNAIRINVSYTIPI